MPMRAIHPAILMLTATLCACADSQGGSTSGPPAVGLPSAQHIAAVPMDHVAGTLDSNALARSIASPYAGNAQAIAEGHALYVRMNCAGCHAYTAKGNMGPDLTDAYWRYGGYPVQIYKSIHDGRAQGMPAWGDALPPQEIWKIVAWIQTLGGATAVDADAVDPASGSSDLAVARDVPPAEKPAGQPPEIAAPNPVASPTPAAVSPQPAQAPPRANPDKNMPAGRPAT